MKKRKNMIGILLYLLGVVLFVISDFSIVSDSPIHLEYFQRVTFCGIAVGSIGTAPFLYKPKTRVGIIIKYVIAIALIYSIFALGGFDNNSMA